MAKNAFVFPPDAGSTNSGQAPALPTSPGAGAGPCGRGIRRFGDIRHVGDVTTFQGGSPQSLALTPGEPAASVVALDKDNDSAPGMAYPNAFDGNAAVNSSGKFGGLDASNEGQDTFSSKQGGR